jgi:hypothetical protein
MATKQTFNLLRGSNEPAQLLMSATVTHGLYRIQEQGQGKSLPVPVSKIPIIFLFFAR